MSSPIQLDDDTDPTSIYTPPWARKRIVRVTEPTPRSRARTAAAAKMRPRKFKPKFGGDRAMLALQRQLALDPDLIPAPASESAPVIRPLLIRLCSVTALAAFVAWGLVSYSDVRKSTEINTSSQAIASNRVRAIDPQPLPLRPTLSQTAEKTPTPVGKSPPVAVASADTEAIPSAPMPATASSAAETSPPEPAPERHANDRGPLQLDADEIAILVKRGKDFLADGDLAAARLLLRRAAEAGSAEGALTLGTTFDPVVLQRLGAIGAVSDLAQARQWYRRAAELGSSAASQQLAGLADGR